MSISRQAATPPNAEAKVLVRFWLLDHHRTENVHCNITDWSKLVYAAQGTLQVECNANLWILPCNRALWVAPNAPHRMKTLGRAQVRTLYFPSGMAWGREPGPIEISPFLKELIVEASQDGVLMETNQRHQSLAHLLEYEIQRARSQTLGIPMPTTPWLREWSLRFLDFPLETPPCDFSHRTRERRIAEETGMSLGQWCKQAKTLAGFRALSQGATVAEAAAESGYATPSGFIQAFKESSGVTPGALKSNQAQLGRPQTTFI
jgi:hypothetical protein